MNKLRSGSLFALIVLLLLASPMLAQTGGVKGTIIDDQTGSTMPGANVFLEKTSYGAATNVDGKFVIASVPPGQYTLIVSYVGYLQYKQAITVVAGQTKTLEIKLQPSAVQLLSLIHI